MGIDYRSIRERLIGLKKQAKMNNFDFCKIYAPEKCTSKTLADNYISALSTGRNYPNERSGPVLPDLEHLQNIVDSERFAGVTMDYLLYGDRTPARVIKTVDLDLTNLTHADFCELLWSLKIKYPDKITICKDTEYYDCNAEYDTGYSYPQKESMIIKIEASTTSIYNDEIDFSLGKAIGYFYYDMKDADSIHNEEVRQFAFSKALENVRDKTYVDNPYFKKLSDCDSDFVFIHF